jgi:hypothetical protein
VVIDADDRIFSLAVEKEWKKVMEDVSTAIDNAAKQIFSPNYDQEVPTSYGNSVGGAYGPRNGGQQQPTLFTMHDSVRKICAALFMNVVILRLLSFANCACFLRSNILNF